MNRYELIKKKYNLIMIQAIAYILVASSTPVVINAMESSYRHNNDIINSIENCSDEDRELLLKENKKNRNVQEALAITSEVFGLSAAVLGKMYIEKKYDSEIEKAEYEDEDEYVPVLK